MCTLAKVYLLFFFLIIALKGSPALQTVLISVSEWVENETVFAAQLDVTASKPASAEERMDDVKVVSARMAVGLAGAVIAAGTASENVSIIVKDYY